MLVAFLKVVSVETQSRYFGSKDNKYFAERFGVWNRGGRMEKVGFPGFHLEQMGGTCVRYAKQVPMQLTTS